MGKRGTYTISQWATKPSCYLNRTRWYIFLFAMETYMQYHWKFNHLSFAYVDDKFIFSLRRERRATAQTPRACERCLKAMVLRHHICSKAQPHTIWARFGVAVHKKLYANGVSRARLFAIPVTSEYNLHAFLRLCLFISSKHHKENRSSVLEDVFMSTQDRYVCSSVVCCFFQLLQCVGNSFCGRFYFAHRIALICTVKT